MSGDCKARDVDDGTFPQWNELFGCKAKKKNCCRQHDITPASVRQLDSCTGLLNHWARIDGAEGFNESRGLIWLHHPSTSAAGAAGSDAPPVVADMVLAVPDARWSPVMQYYVSCRFPGSTAVAKRRPYKIVMPPECPVIMELAVDHPRMDAYTRLWRSLCWYTSDEIATEMLLSGPAHEWQLVPLVWQLPDKCTNLLQLEILDVGPVISAATVAKKTKTVVAKDMWNKEFDGVNPFSDAVSHGGGLADGTCGTGEADDMSEREEHSDTDMMAGVGFDHDALEHAEELAKETDDLWGAEPPAEGGSDHPLCPEGGAAATEEEVAMLFGGDAEPEHAAPVATTIAERVAACVVTEYGNVTCPVAPFTDVARVGRLAIRNKEKPEEMRSVEMVCHVHTGKGVRCAFARVRSKLSDHDWLTWLMQTQPLPDDASFEQRRDAAKAHKELFHILFP